MMPWLQLDPANVLSVLEHPADGFQKSQNIWPLVTAFRCILALILRRKMQLDWYSYLEHWLAISLVRNTDF